MNEKPAILEAQILSAVRHAYGLDFAQAAFLALGADVNAAAYRLDGPALEPCFLKLRKGPFDQTSVTVPFFIHEHGIPQVMAPLPTQSGDPWTSLDEYTVLLYPFVNGRNGFEAPLSHEHRIEFGRALRSIHDIALPPDFAASLARETFGPGFRQALVGFQSMAEERRFDDPIAAQMAELIKAKRPEIDRISARAAQLAGKLLERPLPFVLCHTDLHGGNLLVDDRQHLYIVDWDAPLLAPRERDLMFIGAGIDDLWQGPSEQAIFYEGYGPVQVDWTCLAYYRYERIIEDLVAYAEQVLLSQGDAQDRLDGLRRFAANFDPASTIAMADIALTTNH